MLNEQPTVVVPGWVLAAALALIVTAGVAAEDPKPISAGDVVRLVEAMPTWDEHTIKRDGDVGRIETVLEQLQRAETSILRAGMEESSAKYTARGEWWRFDRKVFLINRYVLKTPAELDVADTVLPYYIPRRGKAYDGEWPFTRQADGRMHLTANYKGAGGPGGPGIMEFRRFLRIFGRRERP